MSIVTYEVYEFEQGQVYHQETPKIVQLNICGHLGFFFVFVDGMPSVTSQPSRKGSAKANQAPTKKCKNDVFFNFSTFSFFRKAKTVEKWKNTCTTLLKTRVLPSLKGKPYGREPLGNPQGKNRSTRETIGNLYLFGSSSGQSSRLLSF